MLKNQRTYKKTLQLGLATVLCFTLLFGILLIFSSAYFREKELREISNAILLKCIQETDSTLSTIDQMTTEFLLDNSRINQYMVMEQIENIEVYKMKQSLDRFNNSLNYYYGNGISLYLFAPKVDRIYLKGAMYRQSQFGHEEWVAQFLSSPMLDKWVHHENFMVYNSYENFITEACVLRTFNYPLGSASVLGTANVLLPDRFLRKFIVSSLPTAQSQIYVLNGNDELLYSAGPDCDKYFSEVLKEKDKVHMLQWPSSPSVYVRTSSYTGWQYVLRIPKTGLISLWSPIGTLYALLIILYCAGVSAYLFRLFLRPYQFLRQLIQLIQGSIPDSSEMQTNEFLELQERFLELHNRVNDLRLQVDTYRFDICNRLILDLITPERISSYEEHEKKMRQAGLNFYTKGYCALLLHRKDDSGLSSQQVYDYLVPLRDDKISFLCTQESLRNVLVIITCNEVLTPALNRKYLEACAQQITEESIIIGVGSLCREPQELVASYEIAKLALRYGIQKRLSGIVEYQTVMQKTDLAIGMRRYSTILDSLMNMRQEHYEGKVPVLLEKLFKGLRQDGFTDNMMQMVKYNIIYQGIELTKTQNASRDVLRDENFHELLYRLEIQQSDENIVTLLSNFLIMLYQSNHEQSGQGSSLSDRIARYIDNNYKSQQFSLSLLEDALSMTACHLSRVFKENTGETIQGYLTHLRVIEAQRLMKENPREPLERIAERVGYANVQALRRAFKKETGMSPSVNKQYQTE